MDSFTLVSIIIFILFHTPLCTQYNFWSIFCFTGLPIPVLVHIVLISGYFIEFWNYGLVALVVKNPLVNAGDIRDAGWIPGLGSSPGGGHGKPPHYSCLENPLGQRSLEVYSP